MTTGPGTCLGALKYKQNTDDKNLFIFINSAVMCNRRIENGATSNPDKKMLTT